MLEAIHFIREFIRIDIILAFGLYSILFFIVRLFFKNKDKLNQFDKSATQLLIYTGLIYASIWLLENVIIYSQIDSTSNNRPNLFYIFFQPLPAIIPIVLLKIKFLRKSLIYRILLCIYFLISFEQYVILVTSFHRGHFPNIMNNYGLSIVEWILHPLVKTTLFVSIVILYDYLKKKFNSTAQ